MQITDLFGAAAAFETVRMPDGTERYEDTQRLVFVRSDYLLDIRPTLVDEVGEIHFLTRDENLVSQFCPHFHRYIKEWPTSVTGEVTGNAPPQAEKASPEPTADSKPGSQPKEKKAAQPVKPKSSKERASQPAPPPTQSSGSPAGRKARAPAARARHRHPPRPQSAACPDGRALPAHKSWRARPCRVP